MSSVGMPSVMQTIERQAGGGGFEDAVRGKGRRDEDHGDVGAGLLHGFFDGVEDGPALVRGAALAGRDAADDSLPLLVLRAALGVKGAFAAGDALHDQAGVFVDKN